MSGAKRRRWGSKMQPARKRGFDLFEGDGDEDEDNEEEEEEEDDDYRPQLGGRDEWKEQNGGDFEERERLYSIVPERCVPRLPASAAKKQYRGDPDRAAKKAWRDNKGWGAGVIALTCNKDNKGGKVFAQMVDLRGWEVRTRYMNKRSSSGALGGGGGGGSGRGKIGGSGGGGGGGGGGGSGKRSAGKAKKAKGHRGKRKKQG